MNLYRHSKNVYTYTRHLIVNNILASVSFSWATDAHLVKLDKVSDI